MSDIKDEDFSQVQNYFHEKSLYKSRMAFKIRSQMVPDIPGNFKRKFEKKEGGLICKYCEEGNIMSQSHCMECSAWSELRRGLDLSDIGDLVEFFRKMLDMREKLEAEDVLKRTASHDSCQDDC